MVSVRDLAAAVGGIEASQVRDAIYRAIQESPGITIIAIAELVGVRHQTVCYHLQKLKRLGHIVAHPKGNRLLHFVNGAVATPEQRELIPVAHDPLTMEILKNISERPGIMKKDVAVSVGLTRTGGAWHVNKLARHGIVREERIGGHCYLYVVPERAELLRALGKRVPDEPGSSPAIVEPPGSPLSSTL